MTKRRIRRLLAQIFLGIAYLSVTLQWLWVLATGLPPLISAGVFDSLAPPAPVEQTVVPHSSVEFSPILAVIAGVITLVFLLLTVIILVKLPKTIATSGDKMVHRATEVVIPVITHRKQLPAKKKTELSLRIMMTLQLVLLLVPLVASFFIPALQTLTSQIITTLAIWLATISIVCFIISWILQPRTTSRTQSHASRG